jgi:hypothetical protein
MATDDNRHPDYDRLYYLLGLEPGASAAEITRKYRQLAQVLHPDKWRHSSPAQQRWANEQFKSMKHAREVLERYWSEHHAPPSRGASRGATFTREQIEALHHALQQLQTQRERVKEELDGLQKAKLRDIGDMQRMKRERDAMLAELVTLREEAARARQQAEECRERVAADRIDSSPAQARNVAWLDDRRRGALITAGAIVVAFGVIFAFAHHLAAILLAPFARFHFAHTLASPLQWTIVIGACVLVYGNAWAWRAIARARGPGQQRMVALPANEALSRVTDALKSDGRHDAMWSIESPEVASNDGAFELRAIRRCSRRAPYRHVAKFRCVARSAGPMQTALQFEYDVRAPFWWRLPVARAIDVLSKRLANRLF